MFMVVIVVPTAKRVIFSRIDATEQQAVWQVLYG
jgi:hypothetical protein